MMGLSDRRLTLGAFRERHRSAFHMTDPIDRLVRAISRRNSYALVWAQFGFAHLVVFGGLGLLWLYEHMSDADFWLLCGISQVLVAIDNAISIKLTRRMWRPVWAWERGARDPASTVAAWSTLATLPITLFKRVRTYPLFFSYLPFMAFMTWKLDLTWPNFFVLTLVGSSVLACNLIIRYFTIEIFSRPVLERIAVDLPDDFEIEGPGLPLRWRLFAAAPVINIVTALVVSGLSIRDGRFRHVVHLGNLGLSWLIAVVVSLTISLELIVLVVRSLGTSLSDLQKATDAVRAGDFTVRVPVVATDETGKLAQSFNSMLRGLEERGRLHEAFGAYVDPGLADRVLREGSELAGEEVEVTILFLDIRNFTAFAERAEPGAVVSHLNSFWQLVVPVLLRHGGQANKFIGDGLLAVFGAPERLEDHAERALNAALEMLELIAARYAGRVTVGIGVNSGSVVAGTVGGGGRVEFTVIGDTVNTAARVEAATRETGDDLLITDATKALLCQDSFEFEERPPVPLKGKSVVVRLWAPRRLAPVPAAQSAPQVPVRD
ncbi:MAG: adenylate/guanylate cyclase domain-containing protein [Solirubrobacteraceae bacterium]